MNTQWLSQYLNDVVVVEINRDPIAGYYQWHIPNAKLLLDEQVHKLLSSMGTMQEQFVKLLETTSIDPGNTIVLYDEDDNRNAALAYLLLKQYGYENIAILNGGKKKWIKDIGLKCTCGKVHNAKTLIKAKIQPMENNIIKLHELLKLLPEVGKTISLIDTRTPEEYEIGHIPGAINIPWTEIYNEDGTIKETEQINQILRKHGINKKQNIVIYCRTGHRSSILWFTLKELLKYPNVKVYLGSWIEWETTPSLPIKDGLEP